MKLQRVPKNFAISAVRNEFHSSQSPNSLQDSVLNGEPSFGGGFLALPMPCHLNSIGGPSNVKMCGEAFISKLLDRRWTLLKPDTVIHQIMVSGMQTQHEGKSLGSIWFSNNTSPSLGYNKMEKNNQQPSFYIVRDDLLHPLVNGNKARKLDGLLPLVEDHSVTDLVTCGGCQSAHTAAVAVSCAERGLRSHLLLRGEKPEIPTGYNLISTLYGYVTYVPRSLYAKRNEMLAKHADLLAGSGDSVVWLSDIFEASLMTQISGKPNCEHLEAHRCVENSKRVIIVNEGAGDAVGLLGVIRLVRYLSQNHVLGKERPLKIVVDAGTGTTAIGLGLGAICLGLPWEVYAVMLADNIDGYRKQEERLISGFQRCCAFPIVDRVLNRANDRLVHWLERSRTRKFGNVLTGEIKVCQQIAQQTGVLVDPIYTLAAWELAAQLSQGEADGDAKVVMLHTGGTLGMFGLAQRYKSDFDILKFREDIAAK